MVWLPPELWTEILRRLEDVADFAQAQSVCRLFYAIVDDACWAKVKELTFGHNENGLHVGRRFLKLAPPKQVLLVEELIGKAPISKVSLDLTDWKTWPDFHQWTCRVLELLTGASLRVEELRLNWYQDSACVLLFLASFLQSISGSLRIFRLDTFWGFFFADSKPIPWELQKAFRDCTKIQTLQLKNGSSYKPELRLIESLLHGKTKLKNLELHRPLNPRSVLDYFKEVQDDLRGSGRVLMSLKELCIRAVPLAGVQLEALYPGLSVIVYDRVRLEEFKELVLWSLSQRQSGQFGWKSLAYRIRMLLVVASAESVAVSVQSACPCKASVSHGERGALLRFWKEHLTIQVHIEKFTIPGVRSD